LLALALALALAAQRVPQRALGPGEHAFGWAGDPWEEAVVLHTGIDSYARYRSELGADAAPLAAEPAGDPSDPSDPSDSGRFIASPPFPITYVRGRFAGP